MFSSLKKPNTLSRNPKDSPPHITWLRDYYFQGCKRNWNNEYTAWSTGTPWDLQYQEMTYDQRVVGKKGARAMGKFILNRSLNL